MVVVDDRGETFPLFRSLGLGIAIWRLLRAPAPLELAESTIVVVVAYGTPSWDEIAEYAGRYPTIVAAVDANEKDRMSAVRSGAFGYVDLRMAREGLRRTFVGVLRGEPAFSRDIIGTLLRERQLGRSTVARSRPLTTRQREILSLIAGGATDKEVAASLGIRTATAQKHVANLLRRLGVANRAAAVGSLFKDSSSWESRHLDRRRQ
jgi:DNA-binding NarL/FixJ family response regulator